MVLIVHIFQHQLDVLIINSSFSDNFVGDVFYLSENGFGQSWCSFPLKCGYNHWLILWFYNCSCLWIILAGLPLISHIYYSNLMSMGLLRGPCFSQNFTIGSISIDICYFNSRVPLHTQGIEIRSFYCSCLKIILDVLEKLLKPDINALLHEFAFQVWVVWSLFWGVYSCLLAFSREKRLSIDFKLQRLSVYFLGNCYKSLYFWWAYNWLLYAASLWVMYRSPDW